MDFFDAKGLLEALVRRLGLTGIRLDDGDGDAGGEPLPPELHPGQSARVRFQEGSLGFVGALHPDVMTSWGFRTGTFVAELSLDRLGSSAAVRVRSLPRAPAVSRDLSIICGEAVPARAIEERVRQAAGALLRDVTVVDRYQGPQLPERHVSLTLTLVYQDANRTLTSEEVEASLGRVVGELRSSGWEIRGV